MAMTEYKCPECGARFKADSEQEYGFCSYCGAQICMKDEAIEIRYSGEILITDAEPLEDMLEEGNDFVNAENFYQAERKFYQALEAYPDRPEGYERLVCAITHNYTAYAVGNAKRACDLMEKMVAVAPEREKDRYRNLQKKVVDAYASAYDENPPDYDWMELRKYNSVILPNFLSSIFCLAFVVYILRSPEEGAFITLAIIIFAFFGILSGILSAVCFKQRMDLKKRMKEKGNL